MKCINKIIVCVFITIMASMITACNQAEIQMPFSDFDKEDSIGVTFSKSDALISGFAYDLTTFTEDYNSEYDLQNAGAGLLVDINNNSVLFAENAFERNYPASLTKIMTAYLALKYCSLDEKIVVTDGVNLISDPTAVKLGLKPGDTLTMDQALHLCLIPSNNDVAVAIACHISGTEEAFCELMNEEAIKLGATNTHFTDSCGLGSEDHYTSVYDLYLIFNKALEYREFGEIINCKEYQTTYYNRFEEPFSVSCKSTNQYFRDSIEVPDNINIIGGKTGTTDDAGYCLMLYIKDNYSNPYIAIILNADSRENLYSQMTQLLGQIKN